MTGVQGWHQFLTGRSRMLAEYDIARNQSKAHEVETHHGRVAEAVFRKWLTSFLPKRYDVCAGYIISQGATSEERVPHFDVIIYDALNAPVLWVEDHPDATVAGASRAIPAEYVKCVVEVKSAFSSTTSTQVLEHLRDLEPLVQVESPNERYRKFLPPNFFCLAVFFELRETEQNSVAALDNLVPGDDMPRFAGGMILRRQGASGEASGRIMRIVQQEERSTSLVKDTSTLFGTAFSNTKRLATGQHQGALLNWTVWDFSRFAWDILAIMNGTYDPHLMSSLHGLVWRDQRVRTTKP